jgi:phospholipid transport system substrate-binding protein
MLQQLYTAIFAFSLFVGAAVSAEESQRGKLQEAIDAALDVIYSDCCTQFSDEEKQIKVRETLEAKYDLDVIIRRAIGRNWRLMSETEQGQVLELVKQLVLKAYVQGLSGQDRPEVTLGGVTTLSEKRMEIQSTVILDGKTYFVIYRLGRMESGWQIYDIVAENISLVSNYRQQLDDHFRKGTGAGLITRLEELLTKDEINENTQL